MYINETIPKPYVIFTGDASDYKQAKIAYGLLEWKPEACVAQYVSSDFTGKIFPDVVECSSFDEAIAEGAKTLLLGFSPFETELPPKYNYVIEAALHAGLNVASGLHTKLEENLYFSNMAMLHDVEIFDFRHREAEFEKGQGKSRSGKRLLTVGTDCACGKKYTALTIHKSLTDINISNTFRSTGQTGFLISESGINNDTIPADFLTGAAEWLTPPNKPQHWDIIEGQGALSHPSFCAGAMSLIWGTQPDVIIMCHDPVREHQRGVDRKIPNLKEEIDFVLDIARRVNPNCRLGGISIFGKDLSDSEAYYTIAKLNKRFNVPVFDPARGPDFNHNYLHLIKNLQQETIRQK